MRVTYDPYADAVYIDIARVKGTVETKLVDNWVAVDIGADRAVIGFEILDASSRLDVEKLKTLDFEELGPPTPYIPHAEATAVHDRKSDYKSEQSE